MIHPSVTPEPSEGPGRDAVEAPPGPPSEGMREVEVRTEPAAKDDSSAPPAAPPPANHAEAAAPETPHVEAREGPSAPTSSPAHTQPEVVPIEVVRRLETRIRRLEKIVSALLKRKSTPPRRSSVPIAPAAMVEWKPPAETPAAPPVRSAPVETPRRPASAPRVVVPPPAPVAEEPPAAPVIAAPPPPAPVAAIVPEIPTANLAPAPPVASLAPSEPLAHVAPAPSSPGIRERMLAAGRRMLGSPVAGQAMVAAAAAAVPVARAAAAMAATPAGSPNHPFHHPWLIMEAYHELRGVIRMYMDRSYRPGIYAWAVPVVALSFMICSSIFISGIMFVGPILDKIIDLGLAYAAYKVMVREAERYELQRPKTA